MMPRFISDALDDSFECSPKVFDNLITGWIPGDFKSKRQIIFPGLIRENRTMWSFDEITDAATLFNAIELFVEKMGVRPTAPHRTARLLLENTMVREIKAIADDAADYFKPFNDVRSGDIIYFRPLDLMERGKKYIHAFDKKQMYLSACSSLQFGESEYEIIENVEYSKDADFIGLCEVEINWKKTINAPFFQKVLKEKNLYYTPELDFFLEFADGIKIKKGWIWRKADCYKTFEKFYKTVSKAKKETTGCAELSCKAANSAIKDIYTKFIGWLRTKKNAENEWNKKWFRPDWRGLIISLSTANLLRNGLEIQNKFNCKPFGINHDCFLFVSDEPDALKAFENSCLTDANKFSHEWTLEADKVFDALGQTKLKYNQIEKLGKSNG